MGTALTSMGQGAPVLSLLNQRKGGGLGRGAMAGRATGHTRKHPHLPLHKQIKCILFLCESVSPSSQPLPVLRARGWGGWARGRSSEGDLALCPGLGSQAGSTPTTPTTPRSLPLGSLSLKVAVKALQTSLPLPLTRKEGGRKGEMGSDPIAHFGSSPTPTLKTQKGVKVLNIKLSRTPPPLTSGRVPTPETICEPFGE